MSILINGIVILCIRVLDELCKLSLFCLSCVMQKKTKAKMAMQNPEEEKSTRIWQGKIVSCGFFHIMVAELKVLLEVFLGVAAVDIFWPYFGLDS